MKIKELFKNYEEAKEATGRIEAQEEANGANADTEAAWNEAYTKEFKAWTELKAEIKKLIGVDDNTAKKMIATRYDDIKALINRMA